MPQSNQTAVCHKLYAVKMVSQNYQIFSRSYFANKPRNHIMSVCLLFLIGKDGKDGQNGEIFNNFSLLFYREKLFICFSGTNGLQFVFQTGKDGRDGINGDVPIFCKCEVQIFNSSTLIHCGICKES